LAAAAALLLTALAGQGAAEPRRLDARVIWAHADRVYIASADSVALAPGDLLTLMNGKKTVAGGEITLVLARDLAAAQLKGGSLEHVSHLDRLRIFAERPPLPPIAVLRIGYPERSSLLFECGRVIPNPLLLRSRPDSLAENQYRMVYTGAEWKRPALPLPDTILVRLFADEADEEIALERGELDLAVFWPGEGSSRLRADPRWQGHAQAPRTLGIVAGIGLGSGSRREGAAAPHPDDPALAALNLELFRGDLEAWQDSVPLATAAPAPPAPPMRAVGSRFEVDPSSPGKLVLERFLGRAAPAEEQRDPSIIRLFFIHDAAPVFSPSYTKAREISFHLQRDPYPPEVRARADTLRQEYEQLATDPSARERVQRSMRDTLHVALLFRVRYSFAFDPSLHTYMNSINPGFLVEMAGLSPPSNGP
jgi:hypothetical protein